MKKYDPLEFWEEKENEIFFWCMFPAISIFLFRIIYMNFFYISISDLTML